MCGQGALVERRSGFERRRKSDRRHMKIPAFYWPEEDELRSGRDRRVSERRKLVQLSHDGQS